MVLKDRQIIERKETNVVLDVKVRWPEFGVVVRRIGLIGGRSGSLVRELVDALGVAVLQIEGKAVGKLPTQTSVQGVVISIHVAGGNVYGEKRRTGRLQEVLIHEARQFVGIASLIADGGDKSPRQASLDL